MPLTTLYANQWHPQSQILRPQIPAQSRTWLLDSGSLTQRLLKHFAGDFQVELLSQSWQTPTAAERRSLGLAPREIANIREVLLICKGKPRVYARTVIPYSTLVGENRRLLNLGNKPLGAFLFAHPKLQRGEIEIAPLPVNQLNNHLDIKYQQQIAWGRRSLFYLGHRPLSVCEVFLPSLFES